MYFPCAKMIINENADTLLFKYFMEMFFLLGCMRNTTFFAFDIKKVYK